jgi:predicted phosphodiesterase
MIVKNTMRKFPFILILLSFGIAAAVSTYHVFVFGDLTGKTVPGIYEQAVAECKRLHPDFALTVGDQVWGYTRDEKVLNSRWDDYFAMVAGLGIPLYLCPGNNDIENAQMESIWRARTGKAPNYSWDYGGDHYTVLDNSRWNDAAALPLSTLGWLRDDLAQAQAARYRVVVMHRPYWLVAGLGSGDDPLIKLFEQYHVNLVLSGHIHFYVQKKAHGITYISVPSSGGAIPPLVLGAFYGYLWLTMADDGIVPEVVRLPVANK